MIERNKTKYASFINPLFFSRFKIFIDLKGISPLFILPTCRNTLKALYLGQLSSDTVPAYLMLYMQPRKQPKDLAVNYF